LHHHQRWLIKTISLLDGLVTTVTDGANFSTAPLGEDVDRVRQERTLWQIPAGRNGAQ
jgi:hypothetical protein